MRTAILTLTALLTVATSALPTEKTSSNFLLHKQDQVSALDPTDLEKRDGNWFEASYNCLTCMGACMAVARVATYGYGPGVRMPRSTVTAFSMCGLSCVDEGKCFAAQGFTLGINHYGVLENGQRDSEPEQMLRSIISNGMLVANQ